MSGFPNKHEEIEFYIGAVFCIYCMMVGAWTIASRIINPLQRKIRIRLGIKEDVPNSLMDYLMLYDREKMERP